MANQCSNSVEEKRRLQTADRRSQIADNRLKTADCRPDVKMQAEGKLEKYNRKSLNLQRPNS